MPRRAAGVIERTMNPPATKPPALPAAQAFAGTLAAIVGDLRKLVAAGIHILGPLTWHLSNRIGRAARRVERLMARLAAGSWRPRKPRPTDAPTSKGGPAAAYLPCTPGWLGQKLGYHARGYASQLDHLLNTPETQALLAAAPPEALKSLGRTLRPLCRLLGITPPIPLQSTKPPLAPRPRKPRAARPKAPRVPLHV